MKLLRALIILTFIVLTACAERHREGDAGRTPDEISQFIADIPKNDPTAAGNSDVLTALAMAKDNSTSIYYSESNSLGTSAMGNFQVVTPVNLDVFGFDFTISQISEIKVFFLQKYVPDRVEYALLIQVVDRNGVYHTQALRNDSTSTDLDQAAFGDVDFQVIFHSPNPAIDTIILKSDDVTGEKLQQNIQLQVYSVDASGTILPEGQFSTLIGYL